MKRSILLVLVLLLGFQICVAGQYLLRGVVVDGKTGDPLVGANVYVTNSAIGTVTDAGGAFALDLLQQPESLTISYVGYQKKRVEPGKGSDIVVFMVPDLNLEEVVIQAIRADARAPVAKTDISRKEIKTLHVGQDTPFLLERASPSIVSYSESGTGFSNYGQFRLRGIDQTRVNITLNGAPLNDMIDQGVFFSNFTDFSNSLESIQVQRGVGTSTNGTASYAGSVNFESVELADEQPSAELETVAGSFGTYRLSAAVKTGILENKSAFYSRFSSFRSDGYRHNTDTRSWSYYGSGGYFGDKDLLKFTGFIGRSRNGLAYSPVALSDIESDPKTNYVNENDTDDFGQWMFQAQHTRLLSPEFSLVSMLYYGGAGGDFPFGFYDANDNLVQINYPLTNDHYGLTSTLNYSSDDGKLNAHTGIHGYIFSRNNRESVLPDDKNPYYDEHSRKDEVSMFGKVDYRLGDLSMYGDVQLRMVRYTMQPDQRLLPGEPDVIKNWSFLNPRLGLSYNTNQHVHLFLSYGRSGREPTRVDLLGGFQLNAGNLPSLRRGDVQPEYVNDFEGGVRLRYPSFSAGINGFYMLFENEIAPIGAYVPEGFIQLRKNVPSSFRRGIEVDWNWHATGNLDFSGNATYMHSLIAEYAPEEDASVYTNVHPALSPEWMFNGNLSYAISQNLSLRLEGRYVGESFQEPTNNPLFIMPDFFVANASVSYTFAKTVTIDAYLNNILNTRYYTYGAPVDTDFDGTFDEPGYFIQPPRNFYVRVLVNL